MTNVVIVNTFFETADSLQEFHKKYDWLLQHCDLVYIDQSMQRVVNSDVDQFFKQSCCNNRLGNWNIQDFDIVADYVWIALKDPDAAVVYDCLDCNLVFVHDGEEKFAWENYDHHERLRVFLRYIEVKDGFEKLCEISRLTDQAEIFREAGKFEPASAYYRRAAEYSRQLGLCQLSKDYYAFAAIMRERTEKWRDISQLWYSAYEQIEEMDYQDFNTLQHTFPTISFEKWKSFSPKEKRGRALQYAAYSEENHAGPADSYWMFEKAAVEYYNAGVYDRAVECAVSATNRYAQQYHQMKPELIDLWETLLNDERSKEYEILLYRSFEEIFRRLEHYSSDAANFFFIHSKRIEQRRLKEEKRFGEYALKRIWYFVSNYGAGVLRLTGMTCVFVFVLFPLIYWFLGQSPDFFSCMLYSIDSFLGFNTNLPITLEIHITSLIEALFSYMVLVAISTQIIGKLLNSYN